MNAPIPKGVTAPAVNPDRLPAEVRASIQAQAPAFALESPEPTGKAPAVELIDTLLSRGWKKSGIAEAIGVHPAQVTRVVKGEQTPSPETYKRLVALVESGARTDSSDAISADLAEPARCAATVDLFEPTEDPAPAGEVEEKPPNLEKSLLTHRQPTRATRASAPVPNAAPSSIRPRPHQRRFCVTTAMSSASATWMDWPKPRAVTGRRSWFTSALSATTCATITALALVVVARIGSASTTTRTGEHGSVVVVATPRLATASRCCRMFTAGRLGMPF
ncbi:MAG: helix-turn-helix transcriptional regulator [Chromatiales bacterium]|nr:helix-turn-helix transcriptional regulator [Chromatiales bacterium]